MGLRLSCWALVGPKDGIDTGILREALLREACRSIMRRLPVRAGRGPPHFGPTDVPALDPFARFPRDGVPWWTTPVSTPAPSGFRGAGRPPSQRG
jgi:hypothetical protein